jgi:putative membrane protein
MRTLALAALLAVVAGLALLLLAGFGQPDALLVPLCGPNAGASWTFDAWITVPLALSAAFYLVGTARLWSRAGLGHGILPERAIAYAVGWVALAGALVSPLHRWGEGLFASHMVEHEVVMAIAAPLLVLAQPGAAFLWALPRIARQAVAAALLQSGAQSLWRGLTRPAVATLLHGLAIWAWHAPPVVDAAVANLAVHRLQHLTFLFTALLFWSSLLRRSPGSAAASLVVTMLHTTLLGALLALAPRVLYPAQTAGAFAWGFSPLEDQQLAGLIMWVPAGTVYAGAALWFAARWIRRSGAAWRIADASGL